MSKKLYKIFIIKYSFHVTFNLAKTFISDAIFITNEKQTEFIYNKTVFLMLHVYRACVVQYN